MQMKHIMCQQCQRTLTREMSNHQIAFVISVSWRQNILSEQEHSSSTKVKHNSDLKSRRLKGHCHAIWQRYKRLEGAFATIEFQTNDLDLLLKII